MSTRSRTAGARTRGRPAGAGRRGRLAPGKEARGLEAAQVAIALDSEHVADLATLVRAAGGAAIGAYQEPLGGRPLLLASLPLNAVQPTPFQRDLSPTHAKRLAAQFEAPELLTLGIVYEKWPRFAGGAYSSFLKKVDRFSDQTLAVSLRQRSDSAARLIEIDARVKSLISALKARGFKSPYLRNYVVARINPVRFHKAKKGDTKPPMPLGQALTRMAAAARSFNLGSVSNADLAWVAVGASAAD